MGLKVIHDWRGLEPEWKGAAVALGNFDGVHRGHQRVIADAALAAGRLHAPLAAITFSPHPFRALHADKAPFLLMTIDQQARALESLGVDRLYILAFDAEMAAMSDEAFGKAVLAEGLGARHVAAGFDITFGKGRTGDPESLARYGERYGFSVSIAGQVKDEAGRKISSSAIRQALQAGEPGLAAEMLVRPFAIEGVVVEGRRLGRTLGMPTANVALGDYIRPRLGVYASRTRLPDGRTVPGVCSIGENPTIERTEARLEVWLFDFDEDLYGQTIETDLVAFIRPELTFDGLEPLKAQMALDAIAARAVVTPQM